jgi:predicted phosphoribosyltransferase
VVFTNRQQAGSLLAQKLSSYVDRSSIVLGIARGGVVVAAEIAKKFDLTLSVVVVKKISSPHDPELAIGAIAPDSVVFIDWDIAQTVGADKDYIDLQTKSLRILLNNRERLYVHGQKRKHIEGKPVLLVDDGIATGATVKAAILWLRIQKVSSIALATPIISADMLESIRAVVNRLIVLNVEDSFSSVGQFYKEFKQVDDADVITILNKRT